MLFPYRNKIFHKGDNCKAMMHSHTTEQIVLQQELMEVAMDHRLMTLREVADYLGVPVATMYGWRH